VRPVGPWLTASVAFCLCSAPIGAQQGLPYDWDYHFSPDPAFGGEFGVHMRIVDINHDGFNDLVASDAQKPALGAIAAGKAFVLFGPTLATFAEVVADNPAPTEKLGLRSISVGHANEYGEDDLLLRLRRLWRVLLHGHTVRRAAWGKCKPAASLPPLCGAGSQ